MENLVTVSAGTTTAVIDPSGGAVVTRFEVDGRPLFFEDRRLEVNGKLKRRGGMPLLFPQAGPLPEIQNPYSLAQHGFARDLSWQVLSQRPDSLEMGLESTPETRQQFDFQWRLQVKVSVAQGGLEYHLNVENLGSVPMPVAPGLHPYFYLPVAQRSSLKTSIAGFDPATFDWDSTLVFDRHEPLEFTLTEGLNVRMNYSAQFKNVAVWSEPESEFICLEPWVGPVGTLLQTEQAVMIQPGASQLFSFSLAVV